MREDTDVPHKTARALRYLSWTMILSVPFWLWDILWPVLGLPLGLPVSATMIVCPAMVATILRWQEQGKSGAIQLWRRVVDVGRVTSWRWLLVSMLYMPVTMALSFAVMRLLDVPLPASVHVPLLTAPIVFAAYFIGAIPEEVGWTGYATEPLQARWGVLVAGVLIGGVWAAWHVVPWAIGQGRALWWVVGQSVATVLMRVVMGWIYARGGRSVVLALLFHATINTTYSLFPNNGSHYDPLVVSGVLVLLVSVRFWFPRRLAIRVTQRRHTSRLRPHRRRLDS